ncbi:hypothetical protein VTN31DRAFT_7413 [Thermomyces dupontii]|uniref:uncharacterized protein n=1 Tax=Talaromyces thermophilus TaxID=28565 RepID=UPI003741F9C3
MQGKSLSLICGSLTWLREHKRKQFLETVDDALGDDDEPDWMREYARKQRARAMVEKWKDLEERLAKVRAEEERRRKSAEGQQRARKRLRVDEETDRPDTADEDRFELDDYDSDAESHPAAGGIEGLSASTLALLDRYRGHIMGSKPVEDDADDQIKIFYCSRTHSQLSQFADELRRVSFPSSLPPQENIQGSGNGQLGLEEGIKHLSLGSRKQLCINPKVASLTNATAINERCMELQQSNVTADKRCPYLPGKDHEGAMLDFRDRTLATVQDIEDIGRVGRQLGVCPYYSSRSVVKHSEIVTLPYPLLLQKSAREALNISIKGHVVIIDEAHNLMDAISSLHSVSVTLDQLRTALSQLAAYARKYRTRLKGKNRVYVTQVIRLVSCLADNLESISRQQKAPEAVVQYSDLVAGKGVDQINPHKLSRYLQESKLARKVDGYVEYAEQGHEQKRDRTTVPVLFHVQSFILALMNPSAEGQLFCTISEGVVELKYMLLDPTHHFKEIVEDARAVILAGGTMSPMSDYSDHLFSYVPEVRFDTFSFGHVIPPENLIARTLGLGVSGFEFSFTYDRRKSEEMVLDLGRTIARLCQVIPHGVVAFFPSYDYLAYVLDKWRKLPTKGPSTLSLIERHKTILYESQDKTSHADDILSEYRKQVESHPGGALLLSVVGGRLSEGINFSDRLGRGVIMVGLPFPNIQSAVWKAKIEHVEMSAYKKAEGSVQDESRRRAMAKAAGRDFYENSCMRAVNQCIGRAIRHRNDYAAIVMIDHRYESERIQRKLPAWIRQSLAPAGKQAAATIPAELTKFFARHKTT